MTYTHRNGETDAPNEHGWYWFNGQINGRNFAYLTSIIRYTGSLMAWDDAEYANEYREISAFVGQWWGPVTPPWEQAQ